MGESVLFVYLDLGYVLDCLANVCARGGGVGIEL